MAQEINIIQSQFAYIHNIITVHRNRAYHAVNSEIILTYWEVGKYVSEKIKHAEWGSGVVDQLVDYLKKTQPDLKGYTRRSIYRMIHFHETYSKNEFVPTALAQIEGIDSKDNMIMPTLLAQFNDKDKKILSLLTLINWSSHIEIFTGCKSEAEMVFYILLAYKEKFNVRDLHRQIESGVYERSLLGEKKQSLKLKETYPTAKQLFKDRYMVDFLNLPEVHSEKSLQQGIVHQMKQFILELLCKGLHNNSYACKFTM